MNKRVVFFLVLAATLTVVLISGCRKKDDVTVLKLAHGLDTTHPVHKSMVFMAEKVKQNSAGKLRVDIYPSEQLGTERECIEQLQLGSLGITKVSSGVLESFVPAVNVFGLPYLFRDSEHYWKVLQGPLGKQILDAGQSVGLKGLCYYDSGARSFYTNGKQIKTPGDLAGMKIRVMQSPMSLKTIEAMGGSPTPIAWGELYTSLQQGVVDGAENNPPSFYTSRHYEICEYYTLDEHTRLPDVLVMDLKAWNKLSPEFQRILIEAVDESVEYQKKLWAEFVQKSLDEVEKAGVTIIKPDKEPFRQAVKDFVAEFEGTEIGNLAQKIQEVK